VHEQPNFDKREGIKDAQSGRITPLKVANTACKMSQKAQKISCF
jgi:hypothetical protein